MQVFPRFFSGKNSNGHALTTPRTDRQTEYNSHCGVWRPLPKPYAYPDPLAYVRYAMIGSDRMYRYRYG